MEAIELRRPGELAGIQGLVLPGGESTTMLHHFDSDPGWWPALEALGARECPVLGTCAGVILMAAEVLDPAQRSLGLLDVTVRRNAYGRQLHSFETEGRFEDGTPLPMVFIRAPVVTRVGPGVTVLARVGEQPVLFEQGPYLAATFHPELTADPAVHERFRRRIQKTERSAVT